MAVIDVELGRRSYQIYVSGNLLDGIVVHARDFLRKRQVPVVADANAWSAHGERLSQSLVSGGFEIALFKVEPGEAAKSWDGLNRLTDWMLDQGIERSDHVFVLGGGVVGDLAGFACAVLKRGCGFVQLPTTLLAQVDSSVGGKTAINSSRGKNLIGAFHQPSLVLADTDCLSTLPPREMRAGYAEIVKYGVLGNAGFFGWLEENGQDVLALNEEALEHAIATSIAEKARIVAMDERETSGMRALLNLGHTFGHALEAQTGFSDRLLHGEAVALGMALAARYSARRGHLSQEKADRIIRALQAAGLSSEIADQTFNTNGDELVAHMLHDKKMEAATLPFVLLDDVGSAFLARDVDLADVAIFLDEELVNYSIARKG